MPDEDVMADRPYWSDDRLAERFGKDDKVHEEINEKLDELLTSDGENKKDAKAYAERARKDWLTFFAPVAIALIGLLGTIITLLITHSHP